MSVGAIRAHARVLGLRMAEPGEFTRRAFQNQRMDLAQAEAVADLVDAETAAQRQQALDQLAGGLSQRYGRWRDQLLEGLALLEAGIDFPDEEVPADVAGREVSPLPAQRRHVHLHGQLERPDR